jgi:hypothetical protein
MPNGPASQRASTPRLLLRVVLTSKPMSGYQKTVLCLANSRRPGGNCFAGKEMTDGQIGGWIRPINSVHGGAIADQDRLYEDHSHAELLDIVKIPCNAPKPNLHHQEDHQIQDDKYWAKVGRATWKQIVSAIDAVKGPLWSNGDDSFHGRNDKVSKAIASKLKGSLYLIAPSRLDLVRGFRISLRRWRGSASSRGL